MFDSARLKIKRANSHIDEFNVVLQRFVESDFYGFVIEPDPKSMDQVIARLKYLTHPPSELALILGDALHNLRAALDLAYVEMITLAGLAPTKWTTFRVWEDREKLVATLSKGILQRAPDIIEMLSDRVHAYSGGNEMLEALDSLDIDDKHRLLLPIVDVTELSGVSVDMFFGAASIALQDVHITVSSRGHLNLVNAPAKSNRIHIHNKGEPTVHVLFGEGTSLERTPILPTLHQFSQLVTGILDVFEATVSARGVK